jgi:hypothetical protein
MMALGFDVDQAAALARAARTVAQLDKDLSTIAASASVSIIAGIDDTAAEMLTDWLEGRSPGFAAFVDEQWRLTKPA